MKVLVFAHTPPPHHGQSYMVQQMLDLAGKSAPGHDLVLFHVNAQVSDDSHDIGAWRLGKFLRLLSYILQARCLRWKYSIDAFYYIPAPPKRSAIYRDWLVLFFAAPAFKIKIYHWHAIGLGAWVVRNASSGWYNQLEARITRALYSRHDLSICLSQYSRDEASLFAPRKTVVVPNGIPDPCPTFDAEVWPERQRRAKILAAVWSGPAESRSYYDVLFLSSNMTEKGLFDAFSAATRANQLLQERDAALRIRFTVAGKFAGQAEHDRFEIAARELNATRFQESNDSLAIEAGWAEETLKRQLYRKADCFIFPTTYPVESFGLVLTEAMAFGCSIVTTRWQAIPEVLPKDYPHLVEPHDIEAMAQALLGCARKAADRSLRDHFLSNFTSDRFIGNLTQAISEASAAN